MDLAQYLKSEIARRGISVRKAAEHIGISHVTLLRILKGETPSLDTLDKLSAWTGTDLAYMLQLLGYRLELESKEAARLARLMENNPACGKIWNILESLEPDSLELALDYLKYLKWRLGEGEGGE